MSKLINRLLVGGVSAAFLVSLANYPALAQTVDFSKAEATGQGIIDSLRGNISTIAFTLGLIIAGFLAAFNKITWFWFFAIVLGTFIVFASPTIVGELRTAFT